MEAVYLLKRTDEAALIIQQWFRTNRLKTIFADVAQEAMDLSLVYRINIPNNNNDVNDEEQVQNSTSKGFDDVLKNQDDGKETDTRETNTFYMNVFVASFWLVQMGIKAFGALHRLFGQGGPQDDIGAAVNPTTNTSGGGGTATGGGGGGTSGGPPGPPP